MSSDIGNPSDAAPKPWDRQPGETPRAFHGFVHYRDLPAWSRSIDAAYHEHQQQCEGKERDKSKRNPRAPTRWEQWSVNNGWVERVAHYDGFRAEERRLRREQELDDALDETVRLAKSGLARVAQRLRYMGPDEIQASQLDRWIKNLTEVQLKALGYPDRVEHEHSGPNGGPIPVEQQVDWKALLADPEARKALETLGMAVDGTEEATNV